jgi:hypothetical protein
LKKSGHELNMARNVEGLNVFLRSIVGAFPRLHFLCVEINFL